MDYFEGGGQRELGVDVDLKSSGRTSLLSVVCDATNGSPRSLMPDRFVVDKKTIAEGAALFVSAGCVNCHQRSDLSTSSAPKVVTKPLYQCKAGNGCLADDVPRGLPNYELTATQIERIQDAIHTDAEIASDPNDDVHYTMASLNCDACHVRDEIGGPSSLRSVYFTTTTPAMGDEGRLPPSLTGVGDKLNDDYFTLTLKNGADARPYMKVGMPGFGDAIEKTFITKLVTLDRRTKEMTH